jgi:hypothetical protein
MTGDTLQGTHIESKYGGFDPKLSAGKIAERVLGNPELSSDETNFFLSSYLERLGGAVVLPNYDAQKLRYSESEGGPELINLLFSKGMKGLVVAQGQHMGKSTKERVTSEPDLILSMVEPEYRDMVRTITGAVDESGGMVSLGDLDVYVAHTPIGKGDLSAQIENVSFPVKLAMFGDKHRASLSIGRGGPRVLIPGMQPGNDYTDFLGFPGSPHGVVIAKVDPKREKYETTFYLDGAFEGYAAPVAIPTKL